MPFVGDPGGLDPHDWDGRPSPVARRLFLILQDQIRLDAARFTPATTMLELSVDDSLDAVELLIRIEEAFGITIPDADAERLSDVAALVGDIDRRRKAQWPSPLERRVVAIASEMTGTPAERIGPNFDIIAHIDSPDHVEWIMTIEEEFDLSIPDDEAAGLRAVGQLVQSLKGRVKP